LVYIVEQYAHWLSETPIPKLFINSEPSGFLIGAQREFCRRFPNQREITLPGAHFLQEAVSRAIAKFLGGVRAGALGQAHA
jgi:haloalkane dehalogenase